MKRSELQRALGTAGATAVALGAIIDAGIFVTISVAAATSGTSFLLAIPVAALIAFFSGLSATELGISALASSPAPLSLAVAGAIGQTGTLLISTGAFIAMASVLLTEVLGLSRVIFAMSRNGDLPGWVGAIHPRYRIPGRAIVLIGVIVAVLSAITDLGSVLAASSLALLIYYGLTNFTALRLGKRKLYSRTVSVLRLITALALALTLPTTTILKMRRSSQPAPRTITL